jgi:uncharacterized integral membrane protein
MRFFGWLAFLVALLVAVFAIQNSTLPLISVKLLLWQVETSPVYTVIGSLVAGVLVTVLLWIPYVIRESFRRRDLRKQIEVLQQQVREWKAEARSNDLKAEAGPNDPTGQESVE